MLACAENHLSNQKAVVKDKHNNTSKSNHNSNENIKTGKMGMVVV